jgi:FKBP-type peptidyl-prolyl cis-trans isomerase 2
VYEIKERLARVVTGMMEGEKRHVELTAEERKPMVDDDGIARVSRVWTRPKEMKMPKGEYEFRARKTAEVGQSFSYDPSFPGTVEAVSDSEVTIRFQAKAGDIINTAFGPGRILEEDKNYKVDIDANTGSLIRTGKKIGRITSVKENVIIINYRNPFGGEKLLCDFAVEKIDKQMPVAKVSGK